MEFLKQPRLRPIEWLGLVLVALLVFVWPIPGSIALRNVLLVLAVAVWLFLWFRSREPRPRLPGLKAPLIWYGVLTAWLVIGALLISAEPALSFKELKGQWLRSAVAGLIGGLLAAWAVRPRYDPDKVKLCVLVLAGPIALQILITLGDTAWVWIKQDSLPASASSIVGGKLSISFNVNVLLALVAADFLARARGLAPLMPLSSRALVWLFAAILACTWLLRAMNGTLCLTALVFIAVAIYLRESRGRSRALAVAVVLLVAASAAVALKSEPRWLKLEESIQLGWQTEAHRAWLDAKVFPRPRLQNGERSERSAYLRTAWFKEGALILAERPLGVGFMRAAMGRAFQDKYGYGLGGHADNGLIDFALGAGLPGVFLGAALLFSLLLLGWRVYAAGGAGAAVGMATFLVVFGYALRTLLDSTTRDNFLEQFLFMAAMLAALSAGAASSEQTSKTARSPA